MSPFLDNAPTYLAFFTMALSKVGLTESQVPGALASGTLTANPVFISYMQAISAGAVFMGANSYIGNAPNFMVKSIAEEEGVEHARFLRLHVQVLHTDSDTGIYFDNFYLLLKKIGLQRGLCETQMPATYYEVLIKGSPELIRGFMIGFEEGKGTRGELVFEEHCRVEEDSPLELLYHILTIHHDRTTIIVEAGFHDLLFKAIETRRREVPVEIQSVREITRAGFAFRFRTFSRKRERRSGNSFQTLPMGSACKRDTPPRRRSCPTVTASRSMHRYAL